MITPVKRISYMLMLPLMLFFLADSNQARGENITPEDFNLPAVSAMNLDNGARAFSIVDDVPQVILAVSFGFGRLYESEENAGMAECLARMLSLAGSEKYPGKKLQEKIDSMGGNLSIEASWENTVIVLQVLHRFEQEAFDIVSDLVSRPNFDAGHWEMAKNLVADRIVRSYDDPATIAFEKTREIIFQGKGYGSVPLAGKVRTFAMDDLKKTWAAGFTGSNLIIGVSSPTGAERIRDRIKNSFSGLKKGAPVDYPSLAEEAIQSVTENSGTVFLYPKDLPQATVVVGTAAPHAGDPGYYALTMMNYILGAGSFNSYLMREIRVKRGLAYAVSSVYRARYRSGVFLAYAQTGSDETATVLSLLLDNISRMSLEEVTGEELAWAKNSLNNSYIFNFDTTINLLNRYIEGAYYHFPSDYYSTYPEKVAAVNAADIMRYNREMIKAGLVKVVVGKKELAGSLERFGKVVILPVREQ